MVEVKPATYDGATVYSFSQQVNATNSYSFNQTIILPNVSMKEELELNVEVQDASGESIEEKDFEFEVHP